MEAIKNEAPELKRNVYELMIVVADLNEEDNTVTFRSKTNENILINMCKTDKESWNAFKRVISKTFEELEEKSNTKE